MESSAISNRTREISTIFPLYCRRCRVSPKSRTGALRRPNLSPKFVSAFKEAVRGLEFLEDGAGDLSVAFGPEDVFHYIYAVLHSPSYRQRYADFLKSDFPRVPLPGSRSLFVDLARVGCRLVGLHVMAVESEDTAVSFPIPGGDVVEKVRYSVPNDHRQGRVWINRGQYFEGVPPEVRTFTIGGYQPAEKWLKDRKGRRLSEEDIAHYRKMIASLAETVRRMAEVDEIVDQYGGWPAAFERPESRVLETDVLQFRPRIVEPTPEGRYVDCVPLVPLQVAAGGFGEPEERFDEREVQWTAVETQRRLRPGMFVAQVRGRSMEPAIPDGAWCLFRGGVEGTRRGKTVLVQLRDELDQETGQRYTVKRYRSEKTGAGEVWRHRRITLVPLNPDFEPLILDGDEEGGALRVVAELLEVL